MSNPTQPAETPYFLGDVSPEIKETAHQTPDSPEGLFGAAVTDAANRRILARIDLLVSVAQELGEELAGPAGRDSLPNEMLHPQLHLFLNDRHNRKDKRPNLRSERASLVRAFPSTFTSTQADVAALFAARLSEELDANTLCEALPSDRDARSALIGDPQTTS